MKIIPPTFVDFYLNDFNGKYLDDHINNSIQNWHDWNDYHPAEACSLIEWLGFTEEEYALFVEKPDSLRDILNKYKNE